MVIKNKNFVKFYKNFADSATLRSALSRYNFLFMLHGVQGPAYNKLSFWGVAWMAVF